MKKKRKNYIINLSKKFSIVSQFTSFVAVEERSEVRKVIITGIFLILPKSGERKMSLLSSLKAVVVT